MAKKYLALVLYIEVQMIGKHLTSLVRHSFRNETGAVWQKRKWLYLKNNKP